MSARARRAIACANRSFRSTHPPAHYPTCREARTGTSHACRTRTAQLALAAAAIRFRVAAMLPAATQAGTYLGTTHRQAGVLRKRPAGGQEAAAAPPSSSKAKATPRRRYRLLKNAKCRKCTRALEAANVAQLVHEAQFGRRSIHLQLAKGPSWRGTAPECSLLVCIAHLAVQACFRLQRHSRVASGPGLCLWAPALRQHLRFDKLSSEVAVSL